MATATPKEKKVAGLILQNISLSTNINLSKCIEGYAGVITNHGFKLGDIQDDKYYVLFKSAAARKMYRQNSAWLKKSKRIFKISAESVDFDLEESVLIPHNNFPYLPPNYHPGRNESDVNNFVWSWSHCAHRETNQGFCHNYQSYLRNNYFCSGRSNNQVCYPHVEQVRDMQKIALNANVSHEKCLLLHDMAIDHIRSCLNQKSKIVLIDLLLNSPSRSENQMILRFNEASRTMREIISERSLNPKPMILHTLTIVRKCYSHLELAELNLLLECIEGQTSLIADKKFEELIKDTLEKIRRTIGGPLDSNSNTDHDEGLIAAEETENSPPEDEVKRSDEAVDVDVEVRNFLSLCNEEDYQGQLIVGDIIDVVQPNSMTIQPLGRHKYKVNLETSGVFNNSGERLTSFPPGDPSRFFVTIDFKEKKIFLVEREIIAEGSSRPRVVTFKPGVEEFSPSSEEEEPIFLSRPSDQLTVDVDEENDRDEIFDELEKYISDNPSKEAMKNCKKFGRGSNKMLATLITDIWRKKADWFVSYKSEIFARVDRGQIEIPEAKIRNDVGQNCVFELKVNSSLPSDFKQKAVDLTADFLILKMKDYLKEKESLNHPEEKIIDVDDDSDWENSTPQVKAVIPDIKTKSLGDVNSGLLEKIKELENTIERKEKEVSQLKETLEVKINENENLKCKVNDLRKEADALKNTMMDELKVRTAKLADYERSEKAKDEEIKQLKFQLDILKPTERKRQITVVTRLNGKYLFFRPDENNLLPLSLVKERVPEVRSLFYCLLQGTGFVNISVRLEKGFFHPPVGGWGGARGDIKYFVSETPLPPPAPPPRPSLLSPPPLPPANSMNYSNNPGSINPFLAALALVQQPRPPHT